MKNRELLYMVGGLIVGFLVGIVLIGSSDGLRTNLFGTAGDSGNNSDINIEFDKLAFYEVAEKCLLFRALEAFGVKSESEPQRQLIVLRIQFRMSHPEQGVEWITLAFGGGK